MVFPEAVMWDMDGTLVNTEPVWRLVEEQTVKAFGGTFSTESLEDMVGLSLEGGAKLMQERMEVRASVSEIVDQLDKRMQRELQSRPLEWCAGVFDTVRYFAEAGVPMVLVTSSPHAMTSVVLDQLPRGAFVGAITGDRVENTKPHPEPYLLGAELAGVDVTRTLIFEDSPTGLRAAVEAGGGAVAIPNQIKIPPSRHYSRIPSLYSLDETILERLAQGEIIDLMG